MSFPNYVYFSPYIINIRILGLEAGLYTSLYMTDRWAGLAHAPQTYCFLPVLCVFSLFKVLLEIPETWVDIFVDGASMLVHVSAG